MPQRDQLTYDLHHDRQPVPWKPVLLLAAVLATAGLLLGWVVLSRVPEAAPAAAPAPTEPAATGSPSTSSSSSPSTPPPTGSDASEGLQVPEGSQQAASLFVRAWLDRDVRTRKAALVQAATPGLAEQLMLTDPANIPQARPRGAPVLDGASTFSAQFTQALSTGQKIQVYLVADPASRYGWLATSVDQA